LEGGDLKGSHDVSIGLALAYYQVQDWEGYYSATNNRFRFALRMRNAALVVKALQDLNSELSPLVFFDAFRSGKKRQRESKAISFLIRHLSTVEQFLGDIGERNTWNAQLAEVYYRLSLETFTINQTRAINWAKSAVGIYEDKGPREMEAHAKARIGRIQCESGDYRSALAMYEDALNIFESLGSPVASEIQTAIKITTQLMHETDHQC